MSLITRTDINREFTNQVQQYIASGYTFSPSMSGHQGEEMKVDLDNGKETVRIRLEREHWSDYDTHFYADGLELIVETFNNVCIDLWDTLWSGKGAEVYRRTFYEVNRNRMYTDDKQFVIDRQAKRRERYKVNERKNTVYNYLDSSKAYLIAWNFTRKPPGGKTKRLEDIVRVNREFNSAGKYYSVVVNSGKTTKTFYMTVKASV